MKAALTGSFSETDLIVLRQLKVEITPSQRKELIEVLQNREEVSIREKIDNLMVKANYLLELIATGELSENQRKDLLGAVQQREEELVRSYVESQYMDAFGLLNVIVECADGRLTTLQRQRLIECVQKREEIKI